MAFVDSATTVYARAYLTNRGREYLFNKNNIRFDSNSNDLFEIKTFTLGDPDVNYKTSDYLGTGEVPDLSGKYTSCLKTSLDYEQRNLLFYTNFDQVVTDDVEYNTDTPNDILNVSVNLGNGDIPVGADTSPNPNTGPNPNDTILNSGGGNTGRFSPNNTNNNAPNQVR
jgi:hypothetical protein